MFFSKLRMELLLMMNNRRDCSREVPQYLKRPNRLEEFRERSFVEVDFERNSKRKIFLLCYKKKNIKPTDKSWLIFGFIMKIESCVKRHLVVIRVPSDQRKRKVVTVPLNITKNIWAPLANNPACCSSSSKAPPSICFELWNFSVIESTSVLFVRNIIAVHLWSTPVRTNGKRNRLLIQPKNVVVNFSIQTGYYVAMLSSISIEAVYPACQK